MGGQDSVLPGTRWVLLLVFRLLVFLSDVVPAVTSPERVEPRMLVKIPPQHRRHSNFKTGPLQAHIGILHAGYSEITNDLRQGNYSFDSMLDNAMLDMSLYSAMHGYTYMRVAFEQPSDRYWGWGKASAVKFALEQVDLLVVVDFDVTFMDITLPIEDMLLRWGFRSDQQLVMAAEDPDISNNKWTVMEDGEERTHLNLNIGFMALRNHHKTHSSLDRFINCVDTIPDCEQYRWGTIFPDQTAWNRFVLPMFTAEEVVKAPCDEANGYETEWGDNSGCHGIHVHHAWIPKHRLFELVKSRLLQESFKQTFSWFSLQTAKSLHS